jgi:hypothetical protein
MWSQLPLVSEDKIVVTLPVRTAFIANSLLSMESKTWLVLPVAPARQGLDIEQSSSFVFSA